MIPQCIQLNQLQISKLKRFKNFIMHTVEEECILDSIEEDCCVSSPFEFKIYSSGLGDVIVVKAFKHTCNLSVCDDGELIPDEWGNTNITNISSFQEAFDSSTEMENGGHQ